MRPIFIRMSIPAMAGACAAHPSMAPRPHRGCPPRFRSMVSLYNEAQVRIWPYPRASGEHTIDVLHRLREAIPTGKLVVIWDGAPYHRAGAVRDAAARLNITIMPLPGYSPDLMPVEPLWRWLREDVTYHHCHVTIAMPQPTI